MSEDLRYTSGELRRAFDRSFAEAAAPDTEPREDFVAIRIGARPYAIRLSELAAVHSGVSITPLPTSVPHLLGLVGVSGMVLPAYDLGGLLGHADERQARWIAITADRAVALTFDRYETHVRVPPPAGPSDAGAPAVLVDEAEGIVRSIVSLGSVVAGIVKRVREGAGEKER